MPKCLISDFTVFIDHWLMSVFLPLLTLMRSKLVRAKSKGVTNHLSVRYTLKILGIIYYLPNLKPRQSENQSDDFKKTFPFRIWKKVLKLNAIINSSSKTATMVQPFCLHCCQRFMSVHYNKLFGFRRFRNPWFFAGLQTQVLLLEFFCKRVVKLDITSKW